MQKVAQLNSGIFNTPYQMVETVNSEKPKSKYKLLKRIFFVFVVIALSAVSYGLYMYFKPVQSLKNQQAEISIQATELFDAYVTDENAANTKYLNKVVEVSGIVNDVSKDEKGFTSIYIDGGGMMGSVSCALDSNYVSEAKAVKKGQQIKVKGSCTGYLIDVVLNRCVISK